MNHRLISAPSDF